MASILAQYFEAWMRGLSVTLQLASIIWVAGLTGGAALAMLSRRWQRVGMTVRVFSFVLSGVPILVLLFWFHYPAQQALGAVIDPFWTACFVLTVVNIAAVEQVVTSTWRSLPREFFDAARVCGLSPRIILRRIEVPLLLRQLIGPLLLSQVVMLHMTLFASLISVDEIFRMAQRINAEVYRPVEVYSLLGIFFLAVSLPLNAAALYLRRRYSRDLSER